MKNRKWLNKHVETMVPETNEGTCQQGYEAARKDVLKYLNEFEELQYLDVKRKIESLPLSVGRSWVEKLMKLVGIEEMAR